MASLELPPPTSWPRMRSGVENPFQNAPGPFIFALPNLAGPCPSVSSDIISDCSLACPFTPFDDDHDDDDDDDDDNDNECHRRQSRYHDPPDTLRESPVETAGPLTEHADPEDLPPIPHSPFDDNDSDSDDTSTSTSRHPERQQSSSGSSTPTPSHTPSSPASSESSEAPQEEEEEEEDADSEDSPKEKGRRKRRSGQGARRRRRNRQLSEQGGCVMGPRAMGIPGVHLQGWFQRSHPHPHSHSHSQPPPTLLPLPRAMPGVGHAHVLFPAAYYHAYAVRGPTTWLLPSHAAPSVPGFFG